MHSKRNVCVIDIGSTAVRMVVAELGPGTEWRTLDKASKPAGLGRDVFSGGKITRDSLNLVIKILKNFREALLSWNIDDEDITVIATSAIREAHNRETFIDRIYMTTGFRITVIEGIEENRLTYMSVQYAVDDLKSQLARSNTLIIEVGGGSTETMLLQRSKIVSVHSLNIGTVRVEHFLYRASGAANRLQIMSERISSVADMLDAEFEMKRIRFFIAVGGHARLAAHKAGKKVNDLYSTVDKRDFLDFVSHIGKNTLDENVQELRISYYEADGLLTGLLIYKYFFELTAAETLIVPSTSIREGILLNMASGMDTQVQERFHSQVIASTESLGRKFHFDEQHARQVSLLSLQLFDEFREEHGLDDHGKLLLEVSALLHDIGSYIRFSGHHKHSQYLIMNSEIFGLHRDDLLIVSNVVRYHRKVMPLASHASYMSLSRDERIQVLKLASLLRIADALDRGHNRRIKEVQLERKENRLLIKCTCIGDISAEKLSLADKGKMFEEVFGLQLVMVQK